jgi:hypothetical protein
MKVKKILKVLNKKASNPIASIAAEIMVAIISDLVVE